VYLLGVLHQQLRQKVLGLVAALVERLSVQGVDSFFYALKDRGNVLPVEGRLSTNQDVQNHSTCPMHKIQAYQLSTYLPYFPLMISGAKYIVVPLG
jgi:hypothetical protein